MVAAFHDISSQVGKTEKLLLKSFDISYKETRLHMMKLVRTENLQKAQLTKMRLIATGLLFAMICIYIAANYFEKTYSWIGFVKAFSQAAMVGALADWFAVTALFRHPFGIPIPHTAIIPKNKNRIGEDLGHFIQTNFFRWNILKRDDIAAEIARLLENTEISSMLADKLTSIIISGSQTIDGYPFAGDILNKLRNDNKHQVLLDDFLAIIIQLMEENKSQLVVGNGWFKNVLYQKSFAGLIVSLKKVHNNHDHPLRIRFDQAMQNIIENLNAAPQYEIETDTVARGPFVDTILGKFISRVWEAIRTTVVNDPHDTNSPTKHQMQKSISAIGRELLKDSPMRQMLNKSIRSALIYINKNEMISNFIANKVKDWDEQTMVQKLELQVGSDLQFIRINGTIIGGLVGLILYSVSRYLP